MSSSLLLRHHRSKPSPTLLSSLTFLRSMGGGPRTFPGGLNKWQWKRLHEKKAKEKEKKLLDQEKQLYQARIRSQIRAKLAPQPHHNPQPDPNHTPMSANDYIRALADRFMKAGAEDLWNETDGPIKPPPPSSNNRSIRSPPIDLRRLISKSESTTPTPRDLNYSSKPRQFSVCSLISEGERRERSPAPSNLNHGLKSRNFSAYARKGSRFNFRRDENSSSDDDSDDDDDGADFGGGEVEMKGRKMMSSAALGKHDVKKKRRVPLKFLEQEENLSEHVEAIRKDFNRRNLVENAVDKSDEDSILSQKRFDECNVSPLTVKALSQAGYVQMTRVQEATLSVCLDGNDALVKAKTGTGKSAAFLF